MTARLVSRADVTRRHARSQSLSRFLGRNIVEAVVYTVAGVVTTALLLGVAGALAYGLRLA